MRIIETALILRKEIARLRTDGKRVAFIPTMGNLHEGHLALVKEARAQADIVVVSVFVNPLQFPREDDLQRYPRTLQADCEKLSKAQVDLVYAPAVSDVYPHGFTHQTQVIVPPLVSQCDEPHQRTRLRGIATVMCKLFNLVQPDIVFFGTNDHPRFLTVRRLIRDLNYDIALAAIPTVREKTGLALSSCNSLLSKEEKEAAPRLYQVMQTLADMIRERPSAIAESLDNARDDLSRAGFRDISLEICDADDLEAVRVNSGQAVILASAWLGNIRLIDCLHVNMPTPADRDTATPSL